jgi:hypothetical protein
MTVSLSDSTLALLIRSRKTTVIDDHSGIEIIQRDLTCCGQTFKSSHLLNVHYTHHHRNIPVSDPITWPDIHIRNMEQHVEANISIPFIPLPPAQPLSSTWTVLASARSVKGTRTQRLEQRSKGSKLDSRTEISGLKNELATSRRELQITKESCADTIAKLESAFQHAKDESKEKIAELKSTITRVRCEYQSLQLMHESMCGETEDRSVNDMRTTRMQAQIQDNLTFMQDLGSQLDRLKSENERLSREKKLLQRKANKYDRIRLHG